MSEELQVKTVDTAVVESLVAKGDISGLPPGAKAQYYIEFCRSLGLDPKTQPFQILKLQGREILYAGRGATDQLARNNAVTRELVSGPELVEVAGVQVVRAVCRASLPDGRSDTSAGLVPVPQGNVEAVCNAFMKAETKAKRRATLSLLGLGMMDESETDTLPAAQSVAVPQLDDEVQAGQQEAASKRDLVRDLGDRLKMLAGKAGLENGEARHFKNELVGWAYRNCDVAPAPLTPKGEYHVQSHTADQLAEILSTLEEHGEDAVAETLERMPQAGEELVLQAQE